MCHAALAHDVSANSPPAVWVVVERLVLTGDEPESYNGTGADMTFEELLDQVLAMLQRRGRVSYRTLTRQFALDEADLEDLKEAILFAHPQVVDETGRGLVWTGDAGAVPLLAPDSPQRVEQPGTPLPRTGHIAVPLPEPSTPDAERRQL